MIRKDIKGKIREWFFSHPESKLRVRHIEREVGVPLPSVIRYAKELEKEGILRKEEIAGVRVYCADTGSKRYRVEKSLLNIGNFQRSGIVEYLVDVLGDNAIVIFGGYSRGEDREGEEIGVYVGASGQGKADVKKFEKILGRRIRIFYSGAMKSKDTANEIINGVVVNGRLEAFK